MFGRKFIWDFITEAISKRINRDFSGSKSLFRTSEEWAELHKHARENHPFLNKVDGLFTTLEVHIERIFDFFNYPRLYYVNAIRDKTHVIPTNLEKGKWHDSSERLFFGMMNLMVFFVEHENKRGFDYYKEEKEKENIKDQSVEEFLKSKEEIEAEQINTQIMEDWLEVYNWFKNVFPTYQKITDKLYEGLPTYPDDWSFMEQMADKDPERNAIRTKIFDLIHKLEDIERKEKMEMMQKIVNNYESMWS